MPKQILPRNREKRLDCQGPVHVPFWTGHGLSGLGYRLIASPFRASYCDGLEKGQAVCLHGMHVPCRESSKRATQAACDRVRPIQKLKLQAFVYPSRFDPLHVLWYLPASIMPCQCQPAPASAALAPLAPLAAETQTGKAGD